MSSLKEKFEEAYLIMGEFRRIGYTQIEEIESYDNFNDFEIVLNERLVKHLEGLALSMKLNKEVADYCTSQIRKENESLSYYLESRRYIAPVLFLSQLRPENDDEDIEIPVQSGIRVIAFSICNFLRRR